MHFIGRVISSGAIRATPQLHTNAMVAGTQFSYKLLVVLLDTGLQSEHGSGHRCRSALFWIGGCVVTKNILGLRRHPLLHGVSRQRRRHAVAGLAGACGRHLVSLLREARKNIARRSRSGRRFWPDRRERLSRYRSKTAADYFFSRPWRLVRSTS